ncbi:fimbrial biogenesis chaperone [Aeromonas hydrophila]|uniref:fimbrial biogenesis chaperone n=1 Tax=Aeromonas hydrophila TaxID=644 RepID=UPI0005EF534C|nr:molecular chaperone [Aeromonas hydrophila]QPR86566.1 molecular chaperone [Aeromonas hydrophila]UON51668.1 molecular chaperone [Aeromonas hydrophila]
MSVRLLLFLFSALHCYLAEASIQLSSTRLIFEDGAREVSVTVRNKGDVRLVQSWLDKHQPTDPVPPFAVTPPLAKLERDSQQLLRVHYAGSGLPEDRESMYWLAVQEIPQKADGQNVVQLAVQQRIKVFYRPQGLPGKAIEVPKALMLSLKEHKLTINNPTPYFINLSSVAQGERDLGGDTIAPFGALVLPASDLASNAALSLTIVNDFGAHMPWQVQLNQGKGQGLTLVSR